MTQALLEQEPRSLAHNLQVEIVFFELSNLCNFKCDFCPIGFLEREKGKMDLELFKRSVAEIAQKGITRRIGFHVMGEPLLHPGVYEAIRWVKIHGLQAELSTNGELLKAEAVGNLIDAGLDLLSISLETIVPAEHASRGATIGFEAYYARILSAVAEIVRQSDMEIILTMMNTQSRKYFEFDHWVGVSRRERDFRGKLARLTADIGRALDVEMEHAAICEALRRIKVDEPKRIRIHPRIILYVQLLMDWGNAFTSKKILPATWGYCGYALRHIGILCDGRVTLCCGDYDGRTALGNVAQQSLAEILASPAAEKIRKGFSRHRVVHAYCRRCLGGSSRWRALFRGLLSIYLFKFKSHPLEAPEMTLACGIPYAGAERERSAGS